MSTPLWQAGHLYLPGDLVQPVQVPAATLASITNPGFETGTGSGWTLPGGATVESDNAYAGSCRLKFTGTAGSIRAVNTAVAVNPGTSITASCYYQQGGASAGDNVGQIVLVWYDGSAVEISESLGSEVSSGSNDDWHQSTITAAAPAGAATVAVGFRVDRTDSEASSVDQFTWNLIASAGAGGLIYQAVQAAPGHSGTVEPAWPATLGLTVVDNEVTWEAVDASRVVWEAAPMLTSGALEPVWPTAVGAFITDGSISWECISRRVEDEKCPNTRAVLIVSSKVFAIDGDVVRFCATANPLDWTSENDAGYLSSGLQQANANDMAVLAAYRKNLAAMNASCFQMWQMDPDPAAITLLDQMDGVGSVHQDAAVSVANDLFYLSNLGVRSVAIAVGSNNLAAGDIGSPVDVLVRAAMALAALNGSRILGAYYPGSGQYWIAFDDTVVPTEVVLWGQVTGAGGLLFDPVEACNSELEDATTVFLNGYWTPEQTYTYPPDEDPLTVDLSGFTYVAIAPIELTTGHAEVGVGKWWAPWPNAMPEGKYYVLVSINGAAPLLALMNNEADE